jgi:hypothetical protein
MWMAPNSKTTLDSRKRPAESDPDEQPLTKKFGLLYIGIILLTDLYVYVLY